MCGIAGIIYKNDASVNFERFRRSFDMMQHRGPDHSGSFEEGGIGLYHHRLSIIDLSERSHQPYSAPKQDGGILTYNGEIYNFEELAPDIAVTHHSDTAVLCHLLDTKGKQAIEELNGIFAFAYLDRSRQRLLLARDRLGVKPLYYVDTPSYFAFASEAKVLYGYMPTLRLNWPSIHEFLVHGSSINEENMVEGVYKVSPGTYLEIDLKDFSHSANAFWTVKANLTERNPSSAPPSYAAARTQAYNLLNDAVKRQCISDVPIGAYLSGGIDSSVVVALAARYTDKPLQTFSAAFEGAVTSELPLARLVAEKYQTDHVEMEITTRHIEDEIKDIVFQYDDPFADPAAIPLHLMAKQCKGATKVVLQGDGGDELFAGYGRHMEASELLLRQIGYPVASVLHPNQKRRAAYRAQARAVLANPSWKKAAYMVSGVKSRMLHEVLTPDALEKILPTDPYRTYKKVVDELTSVAPLNKMLYTDMQIILPYTFMEKVDKINMYHGIEARVPLLDNELVDFVMPLPGNYKINERTTKFFLRDMAKDLLPERILHERKRSFGTPMDTWLKTILYGFVKDVFKRGKDIPFNPFRIEKLLELLNIHKSGKANLSTILWRATVLLIWLDNYSDKLEP